MVVITIALFRDFHLSHFLLLTLFQVFFSVHFDEHFHSNIVSISRPRCPEKWPVFPEYILGLGLQEKIENNFLETLGRPEILKTHHFQK